MVTYQSSFLAAEVQQVGRVEVLVVSWVVPLVVQAVAGTFY